MGDVVNTSYKHCTMQHNSMHDCHHGRTGCYSVAHCRSVTCMDCPEPLCGVMLADALLLFIASILPCLHAGGDCAVAAADGITSQAAPQKPQLGPAALPGRGRSSDSSRLRQALMLVPATSTLFSVYLPHQITPCHHSFALILACHIPAYDAHVQCCLCLLSEGGHLSVL